MAGDESDWQKTEWRLIQAVVAAVQDYLQRQVLPAITRAQELPMNSS
jgi:hypothetical protein